MILNEASTLQFYIHILVYLQTTYAIAERPATEAAYYYRLFFKRKNLMHAIHCLLL